MNPFVPSSKNKTVYNDQKSHFPNLLFEFPEQPVLGYQRTIKDLENNKPLYSLPNQSFKEYNLFLEKDPYDSKNYAYKALYPLIQPDYFAKLFFSEHNIMELQKLIKYNVYIASDKKYKIGDQSITELLIIMRAMYLQYSRTPMTTKDYKLKLEQLNKNTIEKLLPDLLSNITQQYYYINDISNNYGGSILDRPKYEIQAGTKNHRSITDVYFGKTVSDYNMEFF